MQQFVLFGGKRGAGKDTCADLLVNELQSCDVCAVKVSLAYPLKLMCVRLYKMFYNIDIPLNWFLDEQEKEREHPELPTFRGDVFTPRAMLQYVGTEVFREGMWSTIWCDMFRNKVHNPEVDVYVIADLRFEDELEFFRSWCDACNVQAFYVSRTTTETKDQHSQHQSETQVLSVNACIENDGSMEELKSMITKIADSLVTREHHQHPYGA